MGDPWRLKPGYETNKQKKVPIIHTEPEYKQLLNLSKNPSFCISDPEYFPTSTTDESEDTDVETILPTYTTLQNVQNIWSRSLERAGLSCHVQFQSKLFVSLFSFCLKASRDHLNSKTSLMTVQIS